MAKINDIHSIIVPAQSANLSAHIYSEVYGGNTGCAIVINGIPTEIGGSSSVSIWVRTISGGTGCFLLGENKNVLTGSPTYD